MSIQPSNNQQTTAVQPTPQNKGTSAQQGTNMPVLPAASITNNVTPDFIDEEIEPRALSTL